MRPILSATETYNYALAKWLDEKLKPLSVNNYTISDVFQFAEEIHELQFNEDDILVSYDVSASFTNVPLEETIQILANKAFTWNWFNETHNLNITQDDLVELLRVATKHQLFQFNGSLYEKIDGVAMGSPLGPLMANTFLCFIEEKLESENKLPSFYEVCGRHLSHCKKYPNCYSFPGNTKRSPPVTQLYYGSSKQQQTTFNRNETHKDW